MNKMNESAIVNACGRLSYTKGLSLYRTGKVRLVAQQPGTGRVQAEIFGPGRCPGAMGWEAGRSLGGELQRLPAARLV